MKKLFSLSALGAMLGIAVTVSAQSPAQPPAESATEATPVAAQPGPPGPEGDHGGDDGPPEGRRHGGPPHNPLMAAPCQPTKSMAPKKR